MLPQLITNKIKHLLEDLNEMGIPSEINPPLIKDINVDEESFFATVVIHKPHTDGSITFAGLSFSHIKTIHYLGKNNKENKDL